MLPRMDFFETYSKKSRMPGLNRNVLHEFLQMEILNALSMSESGKNVSFLGGTALRFAYNINRFSEDLDFDLIDKKKFNLETLEREIRKLLKQRGYIVDTKIKTTSNIHIIYWKFSEVLQEFGINVPKAEKEVIKFEIDFNPPKHIEFGITLVDSFERRFPLLVNNLNTVYAQKLLAIFFRPYQKGRDFYDLFWLVTQKDLEPNYKLLQAKGINVKNRDELMVFLRKKIEKIDLNRAVIDVRRFLFNPKEAEWIRGLPDLLK